MRLPPSNDDAALGEEPLKALASTSAVTTTTTTTTTLAAARKEPAPTGKKVNARHGKSKPKGCVDEPEHFVDAGRRTCSDYQALHLCDVFRFVRRFASLIDH